MNSDHPTDSASQAAEPSHPRVDDVFCHTEVPGAVMDELWAAGWRHQGTIFYRYSETEIAGEQHYITPLRIDVERFQPGKTQRRILRANADLCSEFAPAAFDKEMHEMFQRHSERFTDNVPTALTNFFSDRPATVPCKCLMQRVTLGDKLVAVSFMDIGNRGASSVYAIFDPDFSERRLGTYTLLMEIEHARQRQIKWLYHGYATEKPSHYDYKKSFRAVELLDWATGQWHRQTAD